MCFWSNWTTTHLGWFVITGNNYDCYRCIVTRGHFGSSIVDWCQIPFRQENCLHLGFKTGLWEVIDHHFSWYSAKPPSEVVLAYKKNDHLAWHTVEILSRFKYFHWGQCSWNRTRCRHQGCCHRGRRTIWWRHEMETFFRVTGQWHGALIFSLICTWTSGSAINLDTGDLICHPAHCDVTVIMSFMCTAHHMTIWQYNAWYKTYINSSTPGQSGRQFPDDISRCILVNEGFVFWLKKSLKFLPTGPINNNTALV